MDTEIVGCAQGTFQKPRRQALAVQTEDHPLDYANFEGKIPKAIMGRER